MSHLKSKIALGISILAVMAMIIVPTIAFAGTPDTKKTEVSAAPAEENETETPEDKKAEQAELAKKAKIDEAAAIKAVSDLTGSEAVTDITVEDLGDENGTVIYELSGTDSTGKEVEVKVDAETGKVLPQEADEEE